MSRPFVNLVGWREAKAPERFFLNTYVNLAGEQEVYVWKHKGFLAPRYLLDKGANIMGFLPESGLWRNLRTVPDDIVRISPRATIFIVRFDDIPFCDGFGEQLTKAERPYNQHGVVWPPSPEASDIVVHGLGTRLIRVIFWQEDGRAPTEFAIRMDQGTDVAIALYDALVFRFKHDDVIDFWNVEKTSWWRLPKEASWDLDPKQTTFCIRSTSVGFTPGLGWEITQLERQHGRDSSTGVPDG